MWKTFVAVLLLVLVIDCGQVQGKSPQNVQTPQKPPSPNYSQNFNAMDVIFCFHSF